MRDKSSPAQLVNAVRMLYVRGLLTELERQKAMGRIARRYGTKPAPPADEKEK